MTRKGMRSGDAVDYFDANLFLAAVLDEGPQVEAAKDRLRDTAGGVTSVLTLDEVLHVLRKRQGKQVALEIGRRFAAAPHIVWLPADRNLLMPMLDAMEHWNLRPRDALHAATALAAGCKRIVSDDPDFDRVKGLRRVALA